MCGRYAAGSRTDDLIEQYEVDLDLTGEVVRSVLVSPQTPPPGEPDFNMAPSKIARVVLSRPPKTDEGTLAAGPAAAIRSMRLLTWGLVPPWSKDPKGGVRMTNARSETLLTSKAFAPAASARRALVPADGWYEWQVSPTATDAKGKPRKQPFFTRRQDGTPLAFAAIYEFWRDRTVPDPADPQAWLVTFSIITQAAEPGLDRIHDRQPVVLDADLWSDWLDPAATSPEHVERLLAVRRAGRFEAYPVSRAVGNTANNTPDLLRPLEAGELVGVVDPMTGEVLG